MAAGVDRDALKQGGQTLKGLERQPKEWPMLRTTIAFMKLLSLVTTAGTGWVRATIAFENGHWFRLAGFEPLTVYGPDLRRWRTP